MENYWLLLTLISTLAVAFITNLFKPSRQPEQNHLPPGPKPWPIIGNLHLLGSIPHQSLHHLSQKYGEIMLLKFGNFPVVIASSPRMAEQFLKVHDAAFASRPPSLAAGKHISYNNSDVSFSPYGPYWREARKILMSELLCTKKLDQHEHIRVEERRTFFTRLRALSGNPVVLREHLSRYTLSTICRMVVTNKYVGELHEEGTIIDEHGMEEMMREWFVLNGVFNLGDWIPWLGPLDLQGYVKRMKAFRKKSDWFFGFVIDDHVARRARGGGDRDFVDALLEIAEDPNAQLQLTRDCLKSLIMNVVLAGPDTSITTVEWAIQEMLRQPHIIEKAREELDREIGRDKWVEENDFTKLPYIDAIIMETFRLHPLATLLPHYAIQDCNVAGYRISKGTTVLVNTWSTGRNPSTWDRAEEFVPERFVGKHTEMTGSNFALLPFGSGRRICPGHNLGLKIVRTTLANLLHGFELRLDEGMRYEDVSMEEQYGLATNPKYPVSIIMKPSLPSHLY